MYQTNTIMEFLGVNRSTVNRFEKTGELKALKNTTKNRWIVEKEDLADFLIENPKYLSYFIQHKPSRRLGVAYSLLLAEIKYKLKMKDEVTAP